MVASNITVDSVEATPGIGHVLFRIEYTDPNASKFFVPRQAGRVGGLAHRQLKYIEVWAAASNDHGALDADGNPTSATLVTYGRETAAHLGLVEGTARFYWFRALDNTNRQGVFWNGQTSGLQATAGFASINSLVNGKIDASVAANALTIAIKTLSGDDPSSANPVLVPIRDAVGSSTTLSLTSATSIVVSSGSNLGTLNNIPFRIWIVGFNDSGAFSLGVKNCSLTGTIYPLAESGLASSTAEGGAGGADSPDAIYTALAVTLKPFKIIGYVEWESGLATAGTWSAGPTTTRLFGPGVAKPGDVVQDAGFTFTPSGTGTTLIPFDSSIPQIGEGVGTTFGVAITPISPVNVADIEGVLNLTYSVQSNIIGAMFRDSETSAFAAMVTSCPFANAAFQLKFRWRRQMGDAALRTYNLRVGGVSAGTLNPATNLGTLGGVLRDFYRVTEIMG